MTAQFVHLNIHSDYSLIDGLVRVKPLISAVADAGMPAVALTDQHNFFAAVKFYSAAIRAGVKPILGADLRLRDEAVGKGNRRFIVLCQNMVGYHNLSRLLSRAYIEGQHLGVPMLDFEWLQGQTEGLICISSSHEGLLSK